MRFVKLTVLVLILLSSILIFFAIDGVAKAAPAPNPYGDRCVDPIWFQKPCDLQPSQLGTTGSVGDCSAHTLTIGEPDTTDHKVYAVIDQCAIAPAPCHTYPKPEDGAGPEAIRVWTQCFTGTEDERRRIRPSCIGRNAPGGRQVLRMWTLAAIPFPGPQPEAQRAQVMRAYACTGGGTPPTPPSTRTKTPTTAPRTPTRTSPPAGCCPPTIICPKGVPPCVSPVGTRTTPPVTARTVTDTPRIPTLTATAAPSASPRPSPFPPTPPSPPTPAPSPVAPTPKPSPTPWTFLPSGCTAK